MTALSAQIDGRIAAFLAARGIANEQTAAEIEK
jgi:hypothetical protein